MKRFIQILLVIVAGETIFMLPFLIPRLLRPLMLESWDLTNQDIGLAFSTYALAESSTLTPDLFFGAFTGTLIDKYPGAQGYTYFFLFTGFMLISGSLSSLMLSLRLGPQTKI